MKNIIKSLVRIILTLLIILFILFVVFFRREIFVDWNPFPSAFWVLKLEVLEKDYVLLWENKYIVRYDFDLISILENLWYKRVDSKWVGNFILDLNNNEFIFSINHYFSNYRIYKLTKVD